MNLKLRPITEEEFRVFRQYAIDDFARAKREGEGLSVEESQEVSLKAFNQLLSDGVNTKNHFVYHIENGGKFVGYLWWALQEKKSGNQGYLYNIDIEASQRGNGYGEAAMILFENEVRLRGLNKTGLHVFGFNTRAQNLYRKLGYEPTNIIMVKKLPH